MTEVTTTESWWGVGTESLQTYAWNITTLGGDRLAPPPLRGDDLRVPYRPGEVPMPRIPDSRTITLGMWVQGSNEDGSMPTDEISRHKFMQNWRHLRRLLWSIEEFDLTKRFVDDTGALVEATARARYEDGLNPTMHGNSHAAFTVDLRLADPFFYGEAVPFDFDPDQEIDIFNPGDYVTNMITLELAGGSEFFNVAGNVRLGITQPGTVDVYNHTVINAGSEDGQITHTGSPQWFALSPGSNPVSYTGPAAGSLTYRPTYF